ncbi:DUF1524 domain-containing protein [Gordonia sinesedis]
MRVGARGAAALTVFVVGGTAALVAGPMTPSATQSGDRPESAPTSSGAVTVDESPSATSGSATSQDGRSSLPLDDLDALTVKGRAPKTGYSRDLFGQRWSDDVAVADGHNGCDTRNDILRRDLSSAVTDPRTRGCVVMSGVLHDPYTGAVVRFTRGTSLVQIDHVVALSDAWQKGAQGWSADRRRDFANDPRNLRAVSGTANLRKGSGDAATWLPPSRPFRCTYVAAQVEVKRVYGLWVTQAEKDAMRRVLTGCPDRADAAGAGGRSEPQVSPEPPAPQSGSRRAVPVPAPAPPGQAGPSEHAGPAGPAGSPARYANCAEVRAAGAAPLRRGEPGYRVGLDGDGDGVACE